MELMDPEPGAWLLDLGSGRGDPFAARLARRVDLRVTLADVSDGPRHDAPAHGFAGVILPRDEGLPFADDAFDIVVSNSVIEHATGPPEVGPPDAGEGARGGSGGGHGSPEGRPPLPEREWRERALRHQRRFARELQRVGRGYFVQTPHPSFPLDLHLWLPFTHHLPHPALVRLAAVTDRFWIKRTGRVDWNLLGPQQLAELLPDARIQVERFVGLPKSVVAWKRPGAG